MSKLSESTLDDAFDAGKLYLTKGGQSLIGDSLRNTQPHIRREALGMMPFLAHLQRPANEYERSFSYSNAELAVALRAFMDDCPGRFSRSLFELIDAWSIALAGMSKAKPSSFNDVDPSEVVGPTPSQ